MHHDDHDRTNPTLTPAARRILDAATDLFYSRGITSVGVELVAEQAGTTKKTIYDRFGSKEGLVVAYLEARARRWQAHVDRPPREGRRRRRATGPWPCSTRWSRGSRWPTGAAASSTAYAELSTSSERATAVVRAEKEWMRELFGRLLAEGGIEDDGSLARQLALVHEGAIVESTAGGSPYALDDARAAMRTLVDRDAESGGGRTLVAQLLHAGHRLAQLLQPVLGVLADQAHAPRQGVGAAAGHAGLDEGVEHDPLGLAQPRHHGYGEMGEDHRSPDPHSAPQATFLPNRCSASRAIEIRSSRVSSRNREIRPRAASVASGPSASPSTPSGCGQRADHHDLLAVDGDLGRSGEPRRRAAAPAASRPPVPDLLP